MKYHFKIHKESKGYWAECIELSGCQTQADNLEELHKNMRETLNLFLSEPLDSKVIFSKPNPTQLGKNIVEIPVDSSVAAALSIRQIRLKMGLTQQKMKAFLGIKNLSNYQRLENPKKSNPEFKTLSIIKQKFPEFSLDEVL